MDATKKRRYDENGDGLMDGCSGASSYLTPQDARKIIERLSTDQILDILQDATVRHVDVLDAVRSAADSDIAQRKLFIRGLAAETTTEGLRSLFSTYGQIDEAVVILDKVTGKSRGYGFVTFRHVDGAFLALKEPSKKIDGRVTVTQFAAAGNSGTNTNTSSDVSMRKIYVANVPSEMPADRLLNHFLAYGDIEEGPLGFDKVTGKSRGFALFVYKTADGAQAALADPMKMLDGNNLLCKLAIDGKKGKPSIPPGQDGVARGGTGPGTMHGDGMGMAPPPGSYGSAGGAGGMSGYGGYSGPPPPSHHMSSAPSSFGTGGYSGQYTGYGGGPGSGGYGGGPGSGGYSGGPGSGGYGGGFSGSGAGSFGSVSGGYGGGGAAGGSYRLPSNSMPGNGYSESGNYGLPSSGPFPGQHHQPVGTSPVPRVPLGGMYPNAPPNY